MTPIDLPEMWTLESIVKAVNDGHTFLILFTYPPKGGPNGYFILGNQYFCTGVTVGPEHTPDIEVTPEGTLAMTLYFPPGMVPDESFYGPVVNGVGPVRAFVAADTIDWESLNRGNQYRISRPNPASRPSASAFHKYKIFVILAVLGKLRETDQWMRDNRTPIQSVARYLRASHPLSLKTLYRGLLLPTTHIPPSNIITAESHVETVSFTENLEVACWFASTSSIMAEAVLKMHPNAVGWIAEFQPQLTDILFHYSWLDSLTQGPAANIYQIIIDLTDQKKLPENALLQVKYNITSQSEVICQSGVTYSVKPVRAYTCPPTQILDDRFLPRPDFILTPPGLEQFGIASKQKINIECAEVHRPLARCYKCQQQSVRMTYHLKELRHFKVDICDICKYVWYSA